MKMTKHDQFSDIESTLLLEAINSMEEAFVAYDADGHLIVCNDAFRRMYGYTDEQTQPGVHFRDLGKIDIQQGNVAAEEGDDHYLERKAAYRESLQGSFVVKFLDGRRIRTTDRKMQNGGFVSTHVDITELKLAEKELRDSEQRFRVLYHQSPMGIILEDYSVLKRRLDRLRREGITDFERYFQDHGDELKAALLDIRLLNANDTQLKLFGADSFEEYQEYENDFAAWDDSNWRDYYIGELSALAAGELTYSGEFQDLSPDGAPVEFRCMTRVIETHEDTWSEVITTHEDITERKKLDRMKGEFISTVSHELRTPLTSIRGSLGLIVSGALGALPGKANDLIKVAQTNTERLINLVNDILDVEKLESSGMTFDFRPLNLSSLLADAVETNSGLAKEYGVKFRLINSDGEVIVRGDSDRLDQVVANLLSNAAKFSLSGGDVDISVTQDNRIATVSVTDHGSGIPEEFNQRIFERFSQGDASDTRTKGGTGLGLNISKLIVEKHHGTIGYETEMGIGSTFYFTLPLLQ